MSKKKLKNIDLIKQELHTYIDELSPRELYILDSVVADYHKEIGKELGHRFNCSLCEDLFGSCGLDEDDRNKECCINRFMMFCNMEA